MKVEVLWKDGSIDTYTYAQSTIVSKCLHERLYRGAKGVYYKIESLSIESEDAEWSVLSDVLIVPKEQYDDVLFISCDRRAFQIKQYPANSLEGILSTPGMNVSKAKAIVAAKQQALDDIRKLDSVEDLLGVDDDSEDEDK